MSSLPGDIWINIIFPQLDSDNLASCSRVCKYWRRQIKTFLNKENNEPLIFPLLKLEDAYLSMKYKSYINNRLSASISPLYKHGNSIIHWYPDYTLNIHIELFRYSETLYYNFKLVWRIPFDGNVPKVYRCHTYDHVMKKIRGKISLTPGETDYVNVYHHTEIRLKNILYEVSRFKNIDFGYNPNTPQLSDETLKSYIKQLDPCI